MSWELVSAVTGRPFATSAVTRDAVSAEGEEARFAAHHTDTAWAQAACSPPLCLSTFIRVGGRNCIRTPLVWPR